MQIVALRQKYASYSDILKLHMPLIPAIDKQSKPFKCSHIAEKSIYIHTYIHTFITLHFIIPYKPLRFRYETCLKNLTNITDTHKINTYI